MSHKFQISAPSEYSWNTDVTIRRINGKTLIANTGEIVSNSFSAENLTTIEAPYHFNDTIWNKINISTDSPSHAQYDPDTKEWFHYYSDFGQTSTYAFYHISIDSNTRIATPNQLLPLNSLKTPLWQHSFGLTKKYYVICEQPMIFHPKTEMPQWIPHLNITWYIVDRYSGELVKYFISEPYAYYHFINCYENDNGQIIADLAYDAPNGDVVYDGMYLNNMIYNWYNFTQTFALSKPMRFVLDLNDNVMNGSLVEGKVLTNYKGCEFPIVNPAYNTKQYKYMYCGSLAKLGESEFMDTILKVDLNTKDLDHNFQFWQVDNQYPGEVMFVPSGNNENGLEDDGVLLSVVFDGNRNLSFLLILNATDLTEVGRAQPKSISHVPIGFHGRYYNDL